MATAKIDIVGAQELPLIVQLYGQVYRPAHEIEFFRRRFLGRYNILQMVASLEGKPVGFFVGMELKPSVYFSWLYGVLPDCRRLGIATQMMEAVHSWVREHEYEAIRLECQNQARPMLHLAISLGYDIVGIRWDPDRGQNLVLFEKQLPAE